MKTLTHISKDEIKQIHNLVLAITSKKPLPPVTQNLAIKLLDIISNQNLHPKRVD